MTSIDGPVHRDNAESYQWGSGCLGWHFVRSNDLSIIHERMPPGAAEVRHRHRTSRQFFFVLKGSLAVECNGAEHELSAETGLEVLPMTPHQVRNASDAPVEFMVVSHPPSHGDREEMPG